MLSEDIRNKIDSIIRWVRTLPEHDDWEVMDAREFWLMFLSQDHNRFSDNTWDTAKDYAGDWMFCACGTTLDANYTNDDGRPLDRVLLKLGVEFSAAVDKRDYEKAITIFNTIHEYESELGLTTAKIGV